ncbi:MAG: histidine phosphatase family protein [Thermodesulfobacteriota bacterium]
MHRRIYLVRHGETLYQGVQAGGGAASGAYDLTERGVEQIRALAELFRVVEVDRVLASPLARSFDTATLIARPLGLEVAIDEDLREITAGSYDGKTGHEIFSEVLRFFVSPDTGWDTPYLGGETYRQLRARASMFLDRVLADPGWHTVVAVAHGGINNALLSVVLDKGESAGLANVEQDFGCVNVIDHDGDRFVLRMLNFTSYDPLKSGLRLPSVRILADLIGAQLGITKDETR